MKENFSGGRQFPTLTDNVCSSLLYSALPYLTQFQSGEIPKPSLIKKLRPILCEKYSDILKLERLTTSEADEEKGWDTQTTNTVGAHDLKWFSETGLIYASGVPTTAVAVVAYHPSIGMSAAHRNFVTIEDVIRSITNTVDSPLAKEMFNNTSESQLIRMIISKESLHATIRKTVSDTITAFNKIACSNIPTDGLYIMLVGGNFLTKPSIDNLMATAVQTIRNHQAMNNGKASKTGRKINYLNLLGDEEPHGILWGGPKHELYPEPFLYSAK